MDSSYRSTAAAIQETHVSAGTIALWWLGQASFVLRSAKALFLLIRSYRLDLIASFLPRLRRKRARQWTTFYAPMNI
ncbi:hypothetical protein EI42_03137 [Thermosporothrix hazakensis]|jgi:hypothetical protein|uniref:Uncharacterized protein n=1 Tax=Thermosporothrix hazakensis TaxID=644383 RepID=A0A326U545_THEHA|nr:hypothetical protein [Thermosporothrix hazakensis]PZW28383.1 hypothetical protein EI42_03137 [Thermosporothrix hazakensis]GCE46256.1 hypothetical protein KTH_11250 [Thermosporothrix hazakensis]